MRWVLGTALLLLPLLACGGAAPSQPTAKRPTQPVPPPSAVPPAPPPPTTDPAIADPGTAEPLPQKTAGAEGVTAVPVVADSRTQAPREGAGGRRESIVPANETLPAPPHPVAQVEGGEIPRATVLAVLSSGIGRFLQKIPVEAHLVKGRFKGWRLLQLFDVEPGTERGVLHAGDTVLRVNGQSIERPEQFKNVWDSMATQSELLLLVERAGKQSEVRYRIVE
jgi:hypothetical protein